jgi:uncharacterized membrane protein YebE (DUF533 family)
VSTCLEQFGIRDVQAEENSGASNWNTLLVLVFLATAGYVAYKVFANYKRNAIKQKKQKTVHDDEEGLRDVEYHLF